MTPPSVRSEWRQAALAVHAMSEEDRAWLLGELPERQRAHLQPLLAELGDIGIPRDTSVLQEAAGETLSDVSARSVVLWLRGQPPLAAARLLAAVPAWRARLLQALTAQQRAVVASAARELPDAPELERLVLQAARRHLASHAESKGPAWLHRWAAHFKRSERRL